MSKYLITAEQKSEIEEKLRDLYKSKVTLEQSLRQQKEQSTSASEELFLELLELFDSLEFLINYLHSHPELSPEFLKRLPKSIANLQKKLLIILDKREVKKIEFTESKPDYRYCQVIDQEVREDVEPETITQVLRQGFCFHQKVLRPLEVIVAKTGSKE